MWIGVCVSDLGLATEFAKQFIVVELVSLIVHQSRHAANCFSSVRPSVCLSHVKA